MMDRRRFIRWSGLGALPVIAGSWQRSPAGEKIADTNAPTVWFTRDGPNLPPDQYIALLDKINRQREVKRDAYGVGGTVEELLTKFREITGKEAAIYMPSGTLANQLAIAVLSGDNSKVFVQETSHVYRDEADAAQSVYGKRLVPLAKGRYAFTLEELQQEIGYDQKEEYFKTGIGAISIEVPVRRCNAQVVPIAELRKISAWCKEKGYKTHLDGARLHLASAWSGVSVQEYSSLFDTVYMCLYKYLGAGSGAVLCGSKQDIAPMEHLVKVHGGAMYQNWANASMALYHLEGIEDRLHTMRERWDGIFKQLNGIKGLRIQSIPDGCNIFHLRTEPGYDGKTLAGLLSEQHNIRIPTPDEVDGAIHLHVNETLLLQDPQTIVAAFAAAAGKTAIT